MTPKVSEKPDHRKKRDSKSVGDRYPNPSDRSKFVGDPRDFLPEELNMGGGSSESQLELPFANHRVVKSNLFVEARYDWSTQMHRIIMMAAAQLRISDTEFGKQRIYIRDLAALADINTGQIYEEAEKACRALLEQRLEVRGPDGEYHGYNLMSDTHFYPRKGYLEIRFNPHMKSFLLQLKERFTQYMLRQAMQLSSPYSIRFYELCSRWADIGWFDVTLEDLRLTFKLEHKYQQTTDLRRRVIDASRKELKRKCDLYFDYTQVRRGRAIVGFKFKVIRKPKVQGTPREAPQALPPRRKPCTDDIDRELRTFRAFLNTLSQDDRLQLQDLALDHVRREIPTIDGWNATARQSMVEEKMQQIWAMGEEGADAADRN